MEEEIRKMKCQDCKQREGIIEFAEGMLDFTHGFSKHICRQCYIKIIEEKKKDIDENLIEQRKLLITEGGEE